MASKTLWYHGGEITLSTAGQVESNIVLFLTHRRAAQAYMQRLWDQRTSISQLVRAILHLGRTDTCEILPHDTWIQGGFNICVMVEVKRGQTVTRYVFRCPLPHRLAETSYPGTVDEKIKCEIGAYSFITDYCPQIRIPIHHGFGLASGQHFIHTQHKGLLRRAYRYCQRWLRGLLDLPTLSFFHEASLQFNIGAYLLLEYVGPETGTMLSETWGEHKTDTDRLRRLFKGISRTILVLTQYPQQRIGSWSFDPKDCTTALTNRPVMSSTMIFEHSGTPRTIKPHQTYQNTSHFVSDMLTLHDTNFRHDPHAVEDEEDAHERMASRVLLRAMSHHFLESTYQNGPFLLQTTDLHQSNIFVDDHWNVKCLIDLEWICSLPPEMLSVPYWITGRSVDDITGDAYDEFDEARERFLATMDEELQGMEQRHDIPITNLMRRSWDSKGVWFWASLRSINAWPYILADHLLPLFMGQQRPDLPWRLLSLLWSRDAVNIATEKASDEERYQEELQSLWHDMTPTSFEA